MQKLDLPSLPRSVFLVALFVTGMVSTRVASSQIFGSVSAHGTIVLTNIATSAGNPELHLIVSSPEPVRRDSKTPPPVGAAAAIDTSRFSAIIAEASRKSKVHPALLRAVIAVESKFNPRAVSKRGARGLMQLMPDTAKRFSAGDMFDPRENVLAGAQYLRSLLDLFRDDIELALAAYNAGENAVIRAGYRIPALAETQLYVPTVMAHYRRLLAEA